MAQMRAWPPVAMLVGIFILGYSAAGAAQDGHDRRASVIWLASPADQWDHAFPVGNGRLGGMVFGSVNRERVQLNEQTLWMGGPDARDNPQALANLPEVRRLLFDGRPREAYALAERHLMASRWRLDSYQTLGDLRLTFDHEGAITDYRRELDLDTAIARVSYTNAGVRYTREVYASHPARAIIVRLTADRPGALSFSTWIDRSQDARTTIVGKDRLDLEGRLGTQGLSFLGAVKVFHQGGTIDTFPERVLVEGATSATLIVAAATSYRSGTAEAEPSGHVGTAVRETVDRDLATAASTPEPDLRR